MATVKISELAGLVKGNATENDVVPIVNGGATKKMTLTNLRGVLHGKTNQGGSCAALLGGINNNSAGGCSAVVTGFRNTNTNGGEWIGGGQDNTVDDKTVAKSLGLNNYNVPDLNGSIGSYSAILGGARNCINIVTASVYNNDYSIVPSVILSGVDNVIESTATVPANAYYPFVGQNLIAAGVSNCISGSSNSGNYPIGANTILNGAINSIQSCAATDSNSYTYHNTILSGMCNRIIGTGLAHNTVAGFSTVMTGSSAETDVSFNTAIGYRQTVAADNDNNAQRNVLMGGQDLAICASGNGVNDNAILGGSNNRVCSVTLQARYNGILGGNSNAISDIECAVVLGGSLQTATVQGGTHVEQLVIKSTAIPTADPGVAGQVWVDTAAGNTLKISL